MKQSTSLHTHCPPYRYIYNTPQRTQTRGSDALQLAQQIIIVDDQPDIRDLIAQTLADEGYAVSAYEDGQAVVAQAAVNPPRLILLDLMMPKMSGWQILTALKSARASASVPVVLVSASRDLPRTAQQFDVEFLPKPFDLDDLLAIVFKCAGPP